MMILSLIINILALIGALTLALITLALWAYISDTSENYEYRTISDEEVLALNTPIPTADKESQN